jgi:hypothetical protein
VEKAGVMGSAELGGETRKSVAVVALDSARDRQEGRGSTLAVAKSDSMRISAIGGQAR